MAGFHCIDCKYLYMHRCNMINNHDTWICKKKREKKFYHHMIYWWQCMRYRSKLNSGQNFLTLVNSQFPLSARSPNYSWIRTRRQRKLGINKYIQITHFFSLEVVTNNLALVISVNTFFFWSLLEMESTRWWGLWVDWTSWWIPSKPEGRGNGSRNIVEKTGIKNTTCWQDEPLQFFNRGSFWWSRRLLMEVGKQGMTVSAFFCILIC